MFCRITFAYYFTHILGTAASRELQDVPAEEQGESAAEGETILYFAAPVLSNSHKVRALKMMLSNSASLIDLPGGCFYMGSDRGLFKEVCGRQLISYTVKRGRQSSSMLLRGVAGHELMDLRCT